MKVLISKNTLNLINDLKPESDVHFFKIFNQFFNQSTTSNKGGEVKISKLLKNEESTKNMYHYFRNFSLSDK